MRVGVYALVPLLALLPASVLTVVHALSGSGRWAAVPPLRMGVPLAVVLALLLRLLPELRAGAPRRLDPGLVAAGGLVVLLAASLSWTPVGSAAYGIEKTVRLAVDVLGAGLVYALLQDRPTARRHVDRWLLLATVGLTVVGLASTFLSGAGRASLFGTDPITFGSMAAIGVLCGLGEMLGAEAGRRRLLAGLATVACATGVVASNSKGPVLAVVLGVALLVLRRTRRRRDRLVVIGVAALAAWTGWAMTTAVAPDLTTRLSPTAYVDADGSSVSVSLRVELAREAWQRFTDDPLLGQGAGSFNTTQATAFGVRIGADDAVRYPHNVVLEVAAELGVVGLVLLAVLGLPLLRRLGTSHGAEFALLVVGGTRSMVTGDLSDHRYLFVAAAIGCATRWGLEDHPTARSAAARAT